MKSGLVGIIHTVNPLLPPEAFQRRHHKIVVAVNSMISKLAHFDGVGNCVQHGDGSFVSPTFLVGVAHTPDSNILHGRYCHNLGVFFGR